MNNLKFSIITVCKNSEDVIAKTIESVITQTYSYIEYIVIDGKSTDKTLKIIQKYKNQIDCVISEEDSGIYEAMNKGIKYATGDIICFINAGDHYYSEFSIEYIAKYINKYTADIYFADLLNCNLKNNYIHCLKYNHIIDKIDLLKSDGFGHPSTFYTRKAFEIVGLFNENKKIVSDYEWNLKALIKFNLKFKYFKGIIAVFYSGGISERAEKIRVDEKHKAIDEYYTKFEQYLFNNQIVLRVLKVKIIRKVCRKILKLKLNKLYIRIGDF